MKLLKKIKALFRRPQLDADMSEEMRLHLEQLTEENVAAGMASADARYAALRKFGGVEQAKERCREQRGGLWLEQTLRDARHAARQLRRSPGFTLVAVLTLGLGIGAATALFSLLNALLLRPLPVAAPARLVLVRSANGDESFSYPVYERFRDEAKTVTGLASSQRGADRRKLIATGFGATEAESIRTQAVSGNFFSVMGANAQLGRALLPDDDRAGAPQAAVVLSDAFWRRRFAGEADVLGKKVEIDGVGFTIVGVMPPGFFGFQLGVEPDAWWPTQMFPQMEINLAMKQERLKDEGWEWGLIVGRLRDGATREQAAAELQTLFYRQRVAFADERAAKWTAKQRADYLARTIALPSLAAGFTPLRQT
jgi:hypothetical protein